MRSENLAITKNQIKKILRVQLLRQELGMFWMFDRYIRLPHIFGKHRYIQKSQFDSILSWKENLVASRFYRQTKPHCTSFRIQLERCLQISSRGHAHVENLGLRQTILLNQT